MSVRGRLSVATHAGVSIATHARLSVATHVGLSIATHATLSVATRAGKNQSIRVNKGYQRLARANNLIQDTLHDGVVMLHMRGSSSVHHICLRADCNFVLLFEFPQAILASLKGF